MLYKMFEKCRYNEKIDAAQNVLARKFSFLSEDELSAVTESIRIGIRCDTIDEIKGMLITVDPVLANLWIVWRETVASEAWAAVLRTMFLSGQGEVA